MGRRIGLKRIKNARKKSEEFKAKVVKDQERTIRLYGHDYCKPVPADKNLHEECFAKPALPPPECDISLLMDMREKVEVFMYHRWMPIVKKDALHVVLLSDLDNMSIQRNLVFKFCGQISLFVHCKPMEVDQYLTGVDVHVPLDSSTVNYFVDRVVRAVSNIRELEVCSGCDDENCKDVWATSFDLGEVDKNPYQECRYVETFRSAGCFLLVPGNKWQCQSCLTLYRPLKRKAESAAKTEISPKTNNRYLTNIQMGKKLDGLQKHKHYSGTELQRLHKRMQEVLDKKGMQIDDDVANSLSEILKEGKLTPAQSIFLQQQVKASQKKNMHGMRWDPTLIRLALAVHITSPAAYELLRDTGMVKLPHSRTLFDYGRVKPVEEGIDKVALESVAERVSKLKDDYQKFHTLMADEMYICQNLIFNKRSGELIGYTKLDDVDKEIKALDNYLFSPERELEDTIASKVLVYMIKGVAVAIKEVVATFAVGNVSVDQFYVWTWKVISALEKSGIAVICFVTDGFSINRAFIKRHRPYTTKVEDNPNGIVFDTVNKSAPWRPLFFMSDVPHLLKTIRNCLLNSRSDGKKSRRNMILKGKRITWDYIVKLYNLEKGNNLRKCFKLNVMNVFPDSYARMKVCYAAQILSLTVAIALKAENWEGASELVNFLTWVNNWFDCLNGAHSDTAHRERNDYISAYTKDNMKERSDYMKGFLKYLDDWKHEAYNASNDTLIEDVTLDEGIDGCDDMEVAEEGGDPNSQETPAQKRILASQTLEGIELSTRSFMVMVEFLLKNGVNFINGRVFTQDPLEQHFSKVRAGQGGSNNPNVTQVLNRNRALHTIGQLGMKRRRGNTEAGNDWVEVSTEPLPKRKYKRIPESVW